MGSVCQLVLLRAQTPGRTSTQRTWNQPEETEGDEGSTCRIVFVPSPPCSSSLRESTNTHFSPGLSQFLGQTLGHGDGREQPDLGGLRGLGWQLSSAASMWCAHRVSGDKAEERQRKSLGQGGGQGRLPKGGGRETGLRSGKSRPGSV